MWFLLLLSTPWLVWGPWFWAWAGDPWLTADESVEEVLGWSAGSARKVALLLPVEESGLFGQALRLQGNTKCFPDDFATGPLAQPTGALLESTKALRGASCVANVTQTRFGVDGSHAVVALGGDTFGWVGQTSTLRRTPGLQGLVSLAALSRVLALTAAAFVLLRSLWPGRSPKVVLADAKLGLVLLRAAVAAELQSQVLQGAALVAALVRQLEYSGKVQQLREAQIVGWLTVLGTALLVAGLAPLVISSDSDDSDDSNDTERPKRRRRSGQLLAAVLAVLSPLTSTGGWLAAVWLALFSWAVPGSQQSAVIERKL